MMSRNEAGKVPFYTQAYNDLRKALTFFQAVQAATPGFLEKELEEMNKTFDSLPNPNSEVNLTDEEVEDFLAVIDGRK